MKKLQHFRSSLQRSAEFERFLHLPHRRNFSYGFEFTITRSWTLERQLCNLIGIKFNSKSITFQVSTNRRLLPDKRRSLTTTTASASELSQLIGFQVVVVGVLAASRKLSVTSETDFSLTTFVGIKSQRITHIHELTWLKWRLATCILHVAISFTQ